MNNAVKQYEDSEKENMYKAANFTFKVYFSMYIKTPARNQQKLKKDM